MFKAVCPYTSQAVVVGQARNFVTMLISLDEDAHRWPGPPAARWPARATPRSCAAPETHAADRRATSRSSTRKLNRWETVKKFAILPRDLSIEAGEITPSMKIKRRSVETNFADEIDKMYAGSLAQI